MPTDCSLHMQLQESKWYVCLEGLSGPMAYRWMSEQPTLISFSLPILEEKGVFSILQRKHFRYMCCHRRTYISNGPRNKSLLVSSLLSCLPWVLHRESDSNYCYDFSLFSHFMSLRWFFMKQGVLNSVCNDS